MTADVALDAVTALLPASLSPAEVDAILTAVETYGDTRADDALSTR